MHILEQYLTKDGTPLRDAIEKFALKLKRDPSTIDRIIRGIREPGPKLVRQIVAATAGEVSADGLLVKPFIDVNKPNSPKTPSLRRGKYQDSNINAT